MSTPEPLGLISLNANGLGEVRRCRTLIQWLNKFHNASSKIIFLQETHSMNGTIDIYFSHGDSGSKGVAIIFPKVDNYKITTLDIA